MDSTDEFTSMEISTEANLKSDTNMSTTLKTPPRMEVQRRNDTPDDIFANETMEEYFGVIPTHPISLCDTTDTIVDNQHPAHARDSAKTTKPRKGGSNAKGKRHQQ